MDKRIQTHHKSSNRNYNIPAGIPALSANAAIANADNGVSSAGLITQVHPQASAAAAYEFQQITKSNRKG